MGTTTTKISRMGIAHADFGYDAGSGLHTTLRDMYTLIGNHANCRYFVQRSLGNGSSVDFEHGLKAVFGELRVLLYTIDGSDELTRVNPTTGYTIAASPSNPPTTTPTTHVRITNGTGSSKDIAIVVVHGRGAEKLDDLDDVDLTTPPEDGQALVYDSASLGFKPGASGDASFKIQSVTDPNAVIKGGYILLPDGRELATYDGSGSASTDFGKDIIVNLDTIFGGNPVNATTYYLYIDLNSLGSVVTQSDTGRKVYGVVEANLYLSTTTPEAINQARYVYRGFLRSADSGTVWSGTGSKFGTLAFLQSQARVPAQSPLVYSSNKVVGSIGSASQIKQGHVLARSSFPSALTTSNLSFWNLANSLTDGFGSRDLQTSTGYSSATGLWGESAGAISVTSGPPQSLYSSSSVFNFGANDFAIGGWFKSSDWGASGARTIFSIGDTSSDRVFAIKQGADTSKGTFQVLASQSGSAWEYDQTRSNGLSGVASDWHHVVFRYTQSGLYYDIFVDGKHIINDGIGFSFRSASSAMFRVFLHGSSEPWEGSAAHLFAIAGTITDHDIRKIASTRIDHNKNLLAERQRWSCLHYAGGTNPITQLKDFVVDQVDTNSLFVDFSDCESTDKIDLKLEDNSANGATSVSTQNVEIAITDNADLTSGISTGLAERPRSITVFQPDSSGHLQPVDVVGVLYVDQSDSYKLKGDFTGSGITPSVTYPVYVSLTTSVASSAVSSASETDNGIVTTGQQSFGGMKTFVLGIQSRDQTNASIVVPSGYTLSHFGLNVSGQTYTIDGRLVTGDLVTTGGTLDSTNGLVESIF